MHDLQNFCSISSKNDHRTHLHKMWRTGKNSPENLWNTRTNYPQTESITNNSLPHWDKQVNTMVTWGLPPLGPPPPSIEKVARHRHRCYKQETGNNNRKYRTKWATTGQSPTGAGVTSQAVPCHCYGLVESRDRSSHKSPSADQIGHNCSREVVDGS